MSFLAWILSSSPFPLRKRDHSTLSWAFTKCLAGFPAHGVFCPKEAPSHSLLALCPLSGLRAVLYLMHIIATWLLFPALSDDPFNTVLKNLYQEHGDQLWVSFHAKGYRPLGYNYLLYKHMNTIIFLETFQNLHYIYR